MRLPMIALSCALLAPLAAQDTPTMLQFLSQRRDRTFTDVDRRVMSFYYTWYGTPRFDHGWRHWNAVDFEARDIAASTNYPIGGPYDSHDPAVIDRHIEQAKRSGVDTFIATWWGRGDFSDEAFEILLRRAEQNDFNATIYWETAPGEGEAQIRNAIDDLVYVLRRYGRDPAFLKVDGKPVIFVYGRVMGQVPQAAWPEIITRTRKRVGHDFLLIADGYSPGHAALFDGVHTYNIAGWAHPLSLEALDERSERAFEEAVELARDYGRISCLTVIPGYDDRKIRDPGIAVERREGETYRTLWENAIEADPDWVLITSWNEWHEGSEIEPSVENGRRALRITSRYAHRFKSMPRSLAEAPKRSGLSDIQRERLQQAWGGQTIGLLPGYGGPIVSVLVDSGLQLRELTWAEVVEGENFTPAEVPLVIFAGTEHYESTVTEEDDVDRALQDYLSTGGMMLVAAQEPYPFFYDETGANPSALSLGLPIVGSSDADPTVAEEPVGWEEPPNVEALLFDFDNEALPMMPTRSAFPDTGDLRWRPASEALLAEGDRYIPLATLTDAQGRSYGEAIAFIEHHASEPVGGRVLYSWMRMDDVVGPDALYTGLLDFLARERDR